MKEISEIQVTIRISWIARHWFYLKALWTHLRGRELSDADISQFIDRHVRYEVKPA